MVKRPRLVRILTVWQLTYLLWRYLPWNAAVWWHLVRQQFLRRLSIIASLTSSSLLWLSLMISRRYYCRLSDSCLCWTDHVREQERSAPGEVQTATDQPVPAYSYTGTHNTHLLTTLPHFLTTVTLTTTNIQKSCQRDNMSIEVTAVQSRTLLIIAGGRIC